MDSNQQESAHNIELEQIILTASDLPTMPIVAVKTMQLIESDRATADELAKVVSSDPSLAARVLKISNSAFYGCQRKIQSLSNAIVMLGFTTIKSLVVTASVRDVFKSSGLMEKLLWEHSFGAGLAARLIASKVPRANPEEAFLSGLFHDIGKIIMYNKDNNRFRTVIEKCYNEGLPFEEVENSFYDFTHAEVGALVVQKWNFPEDLVTSVMEHHRLQFTEQTEQYVKQLTAITNMADSFCQRLGIGTRDANSEISPADTEAAQILQLDSETVEQLLASFEETFESDKSYFTA